MVDGGSTKQQTRISRSEARLRRSLEELVSSEAIVRRKAATRLGKRGNTLAIEPLCKTLEDTDRFVRRRVALALGEIGAPIAIDPLCQRVLNDHSLLVQRAAIVALGQIGSARALDPLCKALQNHHTSWGALESLIKIACPAIVLLAQRADGLEGTLQTVAEQALRQIANHKPPKALLAALADDRASAEERCLCLEALRKRLGVCRRLNPSRTSVQKFCEQALTSQNDAVSKGAREVLDYLTLGRAGQRDPSTDQGILLRAAEGHATTEGTDQLLRASDAAEISIEPEAIAHPTFLDRLKHLFQR